MGARIAPLLTPERTRGTYYRDHRTVLNGMLYRHATGCQWRDLPERYGPWSTVQMVCSQPTSFASSGAGG